MWGWQNFVGEGGEERAQRPPHLFSRPLVVQAHAVRIAQSPILVFKGLYDRLLIAREAHEHLRGFHRPRLPRGELDEPHDVTAVERGAVDVRKVLVLLHDLPQLGRPGKRVAKRLDIDPFAVID